ncbi:type ISP restriction/modification enzyme [Trichormus sp. NMC-1]|uniref:type ISP restriction/modification enzyme n=1 Tax=Trichormus sp. NMC-1 TaxID=1853259 RepID=UPI0015A5F97A|nr:type ISP restriction/modification enzyme [Trichormus sp. NMC-1]
MAKFCVLTQRRNEPNQQIWINSQQYFDQVPPRIWNFYIGGYQVCQKWMKDRKGRELNFDEISHYPNIVSIISETIKMMTDIADFLKNMAISVKISFVKK